MTVEQMHALAGTELAGRANGALKIEWRGKNRIAADDGAISSRQNVESEISRDGLRGGLVAFLQPNDVRAARADDFDAIAQAQPSLYPDVKAENFELGHRRST